MTAILHDSLLYFLENLITLLLLLCFISISIRTVKMKSAIFLIISTVINHLLIYYIDPAHPWIIVVTTQIVLFIFLFHESLYHTVIAFVLSIIVMISSEMLIYALLSLLPFKPSQNVFDILGILCSTVLVFIFTIKLPFAKLYNFILNQKRFFRLVIADIFLITLFIFSIIKHPSKDTTALLPLVLFFSLSIVVISLYSFYQQLHIDRTEQEIQYYNQYQPVLQELIAEIQSKQHDFNNQISAIQLLPITHKDYESLCSAISTSTHALVNDYMETRILDMNYKLLASLLVSKLSLARKEKKYLNIIVKSTHLKSNAPEYDIVKMVGILVDNALEAVHEGDTVTIILDSIKNQSIFEVINQGPKLTEQMRNDFFKRGYTTKSKEKDQVHGLGLNNLLKLVRTYEGEIDLFNTTEDKNCNIHFIVKV